MWQTLNYAMIAEHLSARVLHLSAIACLRVSVWICVCVYALSNSFYVHVYKRILAIPTDAQVYCRLQL